MIPSDKKNENKLRKLRRRIKILLVILVACVALWQAFEYYIDIDRYRPLIINRIEMATGLPVTVEKLDLAIFPLPNIKIHSLSLGHDDFSVSAVRASIFFKFKPLLEKHLDVSDIDVLGLKLTIPRDNEILSERIKALQKELSSSKTQQSNFRLSIDQLSSRDCILIRKDNPQPVLSFSFVTNSILSKEIPIRLHGVINELGNAKTQVQLVLARDKVAGTFGLNGNVKLQNIPVENIFKASWLPDDITIDVQAQIDNITGFDQAPMKLNGKLNSESEAFRGPFTAQAFYDKKTITVNDLSLKTAGAELKANITCAENGDLAFLIDSAVIRKPVMNNFRDWTKFGGYHFAFLDKSYLSFTNLLFGFTKDDKLRIVKGDIKLAGIDLSDKNNNVIAGSINTGGSIEENVLTLKDINGDGFSTQGEVVIDPETSQISVNVAGNVKIDKNIPVPLPQGISGINGELILDRLAGTFNFKNPEAIKKLPDNLVIDSSIKEGSFNLASTHYNDTFKNINAHITMSPEAEESNEIPELIIKAAGKANSALNGPLDYNVTYSALAKKWHGIIGVDIKQAAAYYLPTESADAVMPLLETYGHSSLKLAVDQDSSYLSIKFSREEAPAFGGQFSFSKEEQTGYRIATGHMALDIPVPLFKAVLPPNISAQGLAPLNLDLEKGSMPTELELHASLDLTKCTVDIGAYANKAHGAPASVELTMAKESGGWQWKSSTLKYKDETIKWDMAGTSFGPNHIDINSAALADLFHVIAESSGRISGEVGFPPVSANLNLVGVQAAILPRPLEDANNKVILDLIDGHIGYNVEGLQLRDLHVICANSDLILDIQHSDNSWSGSFSGNKLDIDSIPIIVGSLSGGSKTTTKYPSVKFSTDIDSVLFKNANFSNVTGDIATRDEQIEIRKLNATPYSGHMTASVDINKSEVAVNMLLDGADARAVDEIIFGDNPRGLQGKITGPVKLYVPLEDNNMPLNGMNCEGLVTVTNGSFGKIGMAGKLVAALNATQMLRLKVPSFKDKGLVFNTCNIDFHILDGILFIENLSFEGPAFAMEVIGTVDFTNQDTDLFIQAYVMEGVTSLVKNVPIVGGLAEKFKKNTSINLVVVGPPDNPSVKVDLKSKIGEIKKELEKATQTGEKAIVDKIIGGALKTIGGIVGGQ